MLYPFEKFQGPVPKANPEYRRMLVVSGKVMVHVFWRVWKLQNPGTTVGWPDAAFTHLLGTYYWRSLKR